MSLTHLMLECNRKIDFGHDFGKTRANAEFLASMSS